jgi:NADH-quinone oxidoreductase subunit N
MTTTDLFYLIPFMIIAAAPAASVLLITIRRSFRIIYGFSLFVFIAALLSLFLIMPRTPHSVGTLLVIDSFGILFMGIILVASIVVTMLSYAYLKNQAGEREEYFVMLFIAVLGSLVLVVADHFISFFIGLETLSVSLYVLIAYFKWRDNCIEAGVKFLVVASVATAFLLFGMGLVYADKGTMSFQGLTLAAGQPASFSPVLLAGLVLILAGIGFKLALVPFHMWTPEAYQGAPVPVTAFIATVSKGAVLAVALRLFMQSGGMNNNGLFFVVSVMSVLSMFIGNLLALNQTNLKRLLAYSSIAHLGYLMITLLAGTASGTEAAIFYIAAYIVTTLGAFGVISILSSNDRDAEDTEDVKGLFWTSPLIAIVFTLALLSLAGIPLTAGFMSKFYLVLAGMKSGLWILVASLVINSVISLYYYLRIIKAMFTPVEEKKKPGLSAISVLTMVIIVTGILFLGILPSFLMKVISSFLA